MKLLSPPPPTPCMYVPFLHSTCPANSSSQLSNSPQELSLASLLGPKMWWLESIWMSKQETWGQMLWDIGMVRWFILSLSTRRESFPPHPHMICISFQLSNFFFFFCHIKSRTPSVDKLRMTFNSTVTYIKLSDNNAGMLGWWHGVCGFRSELAAKTCLPNELLETRADTQRFYGGHSLGVFIAASMWP